MAALTENAGRELRALGPITVALADNVVLYDGAICCYNAGGKLVAGSNTTGLIFAGIYRGDKLSQASGDDTATIDPVRSYRVSGSGFAASDVGARVYVSDDNTVAKSTTKSIFAGEIEAVISSSEVWVRPPLHSMRLDPPVELDELVFTPVEQAAPAAVSVENGAIGALSFTAGGATGPEVEALRDKCEALRDDLAALQVSLTATVAGLKTLGLFKDPA